MHPLTRTGGTGILAPSDLFDFNRVFWGHMTDGSSSKPGHRLSLLHADRLPVTRFSCWRAEGERLFETLRA
jgi:hypothetical protein